VQKEIKGVEVEPPEEACGFPIDFLMASYCHNPRENRGLKATHLSGLPIWEPILQICGYRHGQYRPLMDTNVPAQIAPATCFSQDKGAPEKEVGNLDETRRAGLILGSLV
jgi:hypothetical protein